MTNRKFLPTVALLFTILIWGMSFLSIKLAVEIIPPMTLGLVRFVIASILLSIVVRIVEPNAKVNKKDMPMLALAGFIGVTLYFFFENNGIKLIQASTASIVIATIPIFTIIFEAIVFKTRLTKMKILSVVVSFLGVFLVVGWGFEALSPQTIAGCLFMLGAVIAWVIYTIITKPLFGKYSQITIVYYQTIFGTLLFIPFSLMETTVWSQVTPVIMFNVLYLGIFCSALGYYTYVYAMDNLGVSTSSLFLNLMPLVTVIASFFILKEHITLMQVLGGLLIVASVYMASWKSKEDMIQDAIDVVIDQNLSTENQVV